MSQPTALDALRDIFGSGRVCTKCGREKPRMDSSPCFRCVMENVKEAELIAKEYLAKHEESQS